MNGDDGGTGTDDRMMLPRVILCREMSFRGRADGLATDLQQLYCRLSRWRKDMTPGGSATILSAALELV